MNPVHRVPFFFYHFFIEKHLSTSLVPSQFNFSAMRTHAPSLVGGLAAASASCLSQNVRPGGRKETKGWWRTVCRFRLDGVFHLTCVIILTWVLSICPSLPGSLDSHSHRMRGRVLGKNEKRKSWEISREDWLVRAQTIVKILGSTRAEK